MTKMSGVSLAVLAGALVFLGGCKDDDPTGPGAVTFNLTLTPGAMVPPCQGAGAGATGTATVTVNAANNQVQVSNLTFTGLSGPATAARLNFGISGQSGPTVFNIGDAPSAPVSRTFRPSDYPWPVPAAAPMTFTNFALGVRGGATHIIVATEACPNGEIRAQIRESTP